MEYVIAAVIGLLAGAHTSTWGMYKDSPHEGFSTPKYFRSIVVAVGLALVLLRFSKLDLQAPAGMVVFFGFTYVCERGLVELWKTFWRDEDQSKYFIPMQFHLNGRLIKSVWKRRLIGLFYALSVLLICFAIRWLQAAGLKIPLPLMLVTIGSVGGWISAIGGAWKDAPIEGFETFKFFRSPLVALTYATLMSRFTDDWFLITLAGLGYTVATIETYKTFFFPKVPRGKFAGKPIKFPRMLERRQYFIPLFAGIWLVVLATIGFALFSPGTTTLAAPSGAVAARPAPTAGVQLP